jgi:hypothetical protein
MIFDQSISVLESKQASMSSHQCATDATLKNLSYQNTLWYYRAYNMWGADLLNVSCIYEPELFLYVLKFY